jgi:hypothetical protein
MVELFYSIEEQSFEEYIILYKGTSISIYIKFYYIQK